jgi:hypothetical protein
MTEKNDVPVGHLDLALQEHPGEFDKAVPVEVVESVGTTALVHRATATPPTTTVETTATTATTPSAPGPSEELCGNFLSNVSEERDTKRVDLTRRGPVLM